MFVSWSLSAMQSFQVFPFVERSSFFSEWDINILPIPNTVPPKNVAFLPWYNIFPLLTQSYLQIFVRI